MSFDLPASLELDLERYAEAEKISPAEAAINLIRSGLNSSKTKASKAVLTAAQLGVLKASPTAVFLAAYRTLCSMKWRRPANKSILKGSLGVDKVLIDSSTLFDISRALKGRIAPWSETTLINLVVYEQHFSKLTISGMTLFELVEGLYRGDDQAAIASFRDQLLPTYEVIHPDATIEEKPPRFMRN